MLDFFLYRLKVYPGRQTNLFAPEKRPPDILKDAIYNLPTVELRQGSIWHIGNVTAIDDNGLYFRVGRTAKSKIEVYQDGNFQDAEFDAAPYTHALLDFELELCAIARKPRLSPYAKGIAHHLCTLLEHSNISRDLDVQFEASQIIDPDDFITHINRAYLISKFWFTFSRPNPFDVDDVLKPYEALLVSADGEKGKAAIEGKALKASKLESLARSAAATGEDASALIQSERNVPLVRKRLRENPIILSEESIHEFDEKKGILERMRNTYSRIRGIL